MHKFMNIKKAAQVSASNWEATARAGLLGMSVRGLGAGRIQSSRDGAEYVNMSSYSYLGLDEHPAVLQGAADMLASAGSLNAPSTSRIRAIFSGLRNAEEALSDLFRVNAVTVASCAAAAWAGLPMLASGLFTDDEPPVMVFDKNAHFCMNAMKANAADETEVLTIGHNDLEALQHLCRTRSRVAYVADGVYSTGGKAPMAELLELQNRYGLFLFFDEAHSVSALGRNGRGMVLDEMGEITDRTMIITSLNKGFGASGGALFLGPQGSDDRLVAALRSGGPFMWSQRINTAGVGAVLASVDIHRSPELTELQAKLQANIDLFDSLVDTDQRGNGLPIRVVEIGSEDAAVECSRSLLSCGYYVAPLFFPVIAKGRGGVRVMLRANMDSTEVEAFCKLLSSFRCSVVA